MITAQVEGLDRLQRGLTGAPRALGSETRKAMEASLTLIEGDARKNAPQDTRRLAGSITYSIRGTGAELTGRVGPSLRYGWFVEHGRRPGKFPPLAAVSGWARRHGVSPFVVARAIARKGTRPQPFLVPAFEKNRGRIVGLFERVGLRVVSTIARGG